MKYVLFLLLLNVFCCIGAQPVPDIEKQAVFMVKKMFDQIIDEETIDRIDEEYYFGNNGGILGESLYSSLNCINREKTMAIFVKTGKSPLGVLLLYRQLTVFAFMAVSSTTNKQPKLPELYHINCIHY